MDAKSRANFINSVADDTNIPCPNCGTLNKPDSNFCIACGSKIRNETSVAATPAFAPVSEAPQPSDKKEPVLSNADAEPYVEPISRFAEGLPSWDIVPPQVMVRRR